MVSMSQSIIIVPKSGIKIKKIESAESMR